MYSKNDLNRLEKIKYNCFTIFFINNLKVINGKTNEHNKFIGNINLFLLFSIF